MRALDLKLVRDAWRLRGQIVSIALVVGAGVMAIITMRTTYSSLASSQQSYYRDYRFADVFASLNRAPLAVADRVADLPGVAAVRTRVRTNVVLRVPGLEQPASGSIVSVPDVPAPMLNDLFLSAGHWVERGTDDVIVSARFASVNGLEIGDTLSAVVNGRYRELPIVGLGLSPEFVYEVEPTGGFVGDERLFGVLWMGRESLAALKDMDGAFNDLSIGLSPNASSDEVIAGVDALLEPYGGLGAYGRADQLSHRILSDELNGIEVTATFIPIIFLGIAAFLLHMVLVRLIDTQRHEIGVLKAFGYDDRTIGWHFLGLGLTAVSVGALLGTVVGFWLGSEYTALYRRFFWFPSLDYHADWRIAGIGIGVSAFAAVLGALDAVRRAVRLQPAEAMHSDAPARFRPLLLERWGLQRWLTSMQRMILRNMERRPLRTGAAVVGVAFGLAVIVTGYVMLDSVVGMVQMQFETVQREDVSVGFETAKPLSAVRELQRLPGVVRAEPMHAVPVRLNAGHRSRRLALTGLDPAGELRVMASANGSSHTLPDAGVVLTERLARSLSVSPGDTLRAELLDRAGEERELVVAGTVDEVIGINAYVAIDALNVILREEPRVSGALLAIERGTEADLFRRLRALPAVSSASSRDAIISAFERQMQESQYITATIVVVLAGILAAGVIYNGARIALSERSRELAGLRVLGFYKREVATMLLGEQALITLMSIPVGTLIGWGIIYLMFQQYDTELYRLPLIFRAMTIARSALIIIGIATVAGLLVRRRMDRADLIAVLKTRE